MADYAVTGKKGTGKTLFCVGMIRDYLRQGKRVATNLDIYPEHYGRPMCKGIVTRIPDRPTVQDFEALGRGQDGCDEDQNGILVLDETSTFFGARQFGDKSRQPMLDWLVHSRKLGWDVYYICQGLSQIDKAIRESQIEYHVKVIRTDKWPIPFLTPLASSVGFDLRWPKLHIGVIRYGVQHDALLIGRKWYRAKDIYSAYDTQQVFLDREHPKAAGIHSLLSSYHLRGRYMSWWHRTKPALMGAATMGLAAGMALGIGGYYTMNKTTVKAAEVVKLTVEENRKVVGVMNDEVGTYHVVLNDGKTAVATEQRLHEGQRVFKVENKWLKY